MPKKQQDVFRRRRVTPVIAIINAIHKLDINTPLLENDSGYINYAGASLKAMEEAKNVLMGLRAPQDDEELSARNMLRQKLLYIENLLIRKLQETNSKAYDN